MLVNLAVGLTGTLIYLFIFWKKLKEDYSGEIIFKSGFYILFGSLIGWLVSVNYFKDWFLYSAFLGGLIGLWIALLRLKIRFYEALDATVLAFLPWLSLMFFKDSVDGNSLVSFLAFLYTLVIIFLYYYFDTHYKEFSWYKSGKVGFSGLAAMGIVFITRSLIATLGIAMVSFVGRYEAIVSGVFAFISFLFLYNLGRKSK